MSIELTTLLLSIQNLSQPQKHILMTLCFIANKHYEAYRAIERLALDCSCSIKTVERNLKKLRDIGYLSYTGRFASDSKNIPIYRINLKHGLLGGGKNLTTDSKSLNHGLSVLLTTPLEGIRIDNRSKDNKKDIYFSSFSLKHEEIMELEHCLKGNFKLAKEFKHLQPFLDAALKDKS